MKKTALLLSFCVATLATIAQPYSLVGTSYLQNFDGIAGGRPAGWSNYVSATSTSLGTLYTDTYPFGGTNFGRYANVGGADTLSCASDIFGAGFKNCPSADIAGFDTLSCLSQTLQTNRAFAVRQKSSGGYDPGAAFVFEIANTTGLTNFKLAFNLQSLDIISTRVTTWTVDYGFGTTPTSFTPATLLGTATTGGTTASNNADSVNFGSALDNNAGPVWIRIVTLAASSATGLRATSAIDDLRLTWTGTGTSHTGVNEVSAQPTVALNLLGIGSADKLNFNYNVEVEGDYSLAIYDLSGRIIHTENINAQTGTQSLTINGLHLSAGMYFARMSNNNSSVVTKFAVN